MLGLGLGTGELSDRDECIDTVERALNIGYRHIDTATAYENESYIGEALERSEVPRETVVIATKIHSKNLRRKDVLAQTKASRERMDLKQIDILYVHWPAHTYDPEETMKAFEEVKRRGWVQHIGVCNFTVELLEEARQHLFESLDVIQIEFHPLLKQEEIHTYALENEMWTVAYSPLAKGQALSIPKISEMAMKYDVSEAQICLAWLLQKEKVAPIPSTSGAHLRENYQASSLKLTEEERDRIDSLSDERRLTDYEFAPWNQ